MKRIGFIAGVEDSEVSPLVLRPYMHWSAFATSTPGSSRSRRIAGWCQDFAPAGCSWNKYLPRLYCFLYNFGTNSKCTLPSAILRFTTSVSILGLLMLAFHCKKAVHGGDPTGYVGSRFSMRRLASCRSFFIDKSQGVLSSLKVRRSSAASPRTLRFRLLRLASDMIDPRSYTSTSTRLLAATGDGPIIDPGAMAACACGHQ